MTLDFFRSQRVLYPELCFLISSAVGFPVSIYEIAAGYLAEGPQYQVMRWDDSDGPGEEFAQWYLCNRPRFFATPELAAADLVEEWQAWSEGSVA